MSLSLLPIDNWYLVSVRIIAALIGVFFFFFVFTAFSFTRIFFCVWKTHTALWFMPSLLFLADVSTLIVKHLIFCLIFFFLFMMRTHRNIDICMCGIQCVKTKSIRMCLHTITSSKGSRHSFRRFECCFFEQNKTNVWERMNTNIFMCFFSLFILGNSSCFCSDPAVRLFPFFLFLLFRREENW